MTSKFARALTTNDTYTENAMPIHSTSSQSVLDLFFRMGASRNRSENDLITDFIKAFGENKLLTLKAMFFNRDVRGGQGERRSFRIFFYYLCQNYPEIAKKNIENVPYYGRWDDLLIGLNTSIGKEIADYILFALKNGDQLCAKWMPRENKKYGKIAYMLMKFWEMKPRIYRKLLAGNTNVVENLMCKNQWEKITYDHVPSKAISKYRKAFYRHDENRFSEWVESLTKENTTSKIHADAIFPHDIFRNVISSTNPTVLDMSEAQWKALPNYVPENKKILPVCDVSGSMTWDGGLPMEVCVSLGLYLAERNKGPFENLLITFSERPVFYELKTHTLRERFSEIQHMNWGGNTNLEAVFRLILNQALKNNLPQEEMPEFIIIFSDMQFDACVRNNSDNAYSMIKRMYAENDYKVPNVIFWNLRTSSGVPVKFDEHGTALVSGFSPSNFMFCLTGEANPLSIMLKALNNERYNKVKL